MTGHFAPSIWLVMALLLWFGVFGPPTYGSRALNIGVSIVASLYLLVAVILLPLRRELRSAVEIGRVVVYAILLIVSEYLFRPMGVYLDPFYILPIVSLGVSHGQFAALSLAAFTGLVIFLRRLTLPTDPHLSTANTLLLVAAFFLTALLVSRLREEVARRFRSQRDEIRHLRDQAEQRVEQLAALHRLSRNVARALDVDAICTALHTCIVELLACDAFYIARYDEQSSEREWLCASSLGQRHQGALPAAYDEALDQVVKSRQALVVALPAERAAGAPTRPGEQSLVCVPMIAADRLIGALAARRERANAYNQNDVELLQLLAAQAAIAFENAASYRAAQDTATRLAVLNQVAQIVTSTLEIDQVMALIYEQVSRIIVADSYFLATVNDELTEMRFEFLIDDGEQYAPQTVLIGPSISAWVLRNRTPLLLTNIAEQARELGIEPGLSGDKRPSQSWMGVPLLTGDKLLGILAAASYEVDRFSAADLELLQSIGQQAAVALDNARHHARVQEQARLDSLTQVYNHGYFVKSLTEAVEAARASNKEISLIMLDLDYFKKYNDTYGHRVGDAVLSATVAAIRAHMKRTDIVGRWGGEEFGVALPDTTPEQALGVAERIRKTLRATTMRAEDGAEIETPTVSQGLATLPAHAQDVDALIVLADRALYQAKAAGRDRICVIGAEQRPLTAYSNS